MHNYLVKVDIDSNKILEVIKFDGDIEDLMEECHNRNQHAEEGYRYLPMPHCKSEPKIGDSAHMVLRNSVGLPDEEAIKKHEIDIDASIKLLLSTQMTIKGTNIVPIPGVSVEQALDAIQLSLMMLVSLKMMHEHHRDMEAEKKSAISDLFKRLGLKGE